MAVWNETSGEKIQFKVPLKCQCGQSGFSVWDQYKQVADKGPQTSLASLSDNFYERLQKKDRKSIEVVCNVCGAVQPG